MQNPKLDLKSILTIVLIILLAIISFVLVIGYIISSVDPNHSITGYSIAISFVGIFATFGGAYLGAKISGQYAIRLSNQQFLITYSDELLNYLIRVEDIRNDIRKGITDNICKLDELKKDMSSEKELVTFYDYYSALLEIYLHIQMCNMYVGLDKKLIDNLKPPTQLLALAYDNTSQLVNTKENGDKELNKDYKSYDDTLRITNTIIIKMKNHIINLEEKMIDNFDEFKKTYI